MHYSFLCELIVSEPCGSVGMRFSAATDVVPAPAVLPAGSTWNPSFQGGTGGWKRLSGWLVSAVSSRLVPFQRDKKKPSSGWFFCLQRRDIGAY